MSKTYNEYTLPPADPDRSIQTYRLRQRFDIPAVSIITPFFNTGPEFRDTALSVMRQTFQEWEWIIVDDGSTDPTALDMLQEVVSLDDRIRLMHSPSNAGPSASRNLGVTEARGSFILQLDSDDQLEPTAAEKMLWYLESHPDASLVTGHVVAFGAESYVWKSGFHSGQQFLDENSASIIAMLRTEVFEETGGYDTSNSAGLEDWEFWLRCAATGHWGGTIHEPLGWYRRRGDHGDRWANWDDGDAQTKFATTLESRFGYLREDDAFPDPVSNATEPYEPIAEDLPFRNELVADKPRILAIFPWMTFGGADKCNLDALRHLANSGWEVTVTTTLDGDHSWEREFATVTPDLHVMHRFLRTVDFPRYLRYLIGSRKPDIVLVSNSEFGYQVVPYLRAHHPEPTYVDLVHMEQPHWKSGGFGNLSNLYRDNFDTTLVISDHLKRWMGEHGGDIERVEPWHLGVDIDIWRPDADTRVKERKRLGLAEQQPMLLYAGRLNRQKQPRVFADTIRRLADDDHDFVAVVAGDGEDKPWLETYVARHHLEEHVLFLGAVPSERIRDLLQAADLFFLPSEWEGIALSIYEAMASGVTVVGGDVGGQRELVTPECGVLLPRSTPEAEARAYAAAIARLLVDEQERTAMGERSRERVITHFSLETMAQGLDELLSRAMQNRQDDPRPVPHLANARAAAVLAVEYTRLSDDHEAFAASIPSLVPPTKPKKTRLGVGARLYGMLMTVLGPVYRLAKRQRFGGTVLRMRDRVRRTLGYRRVDSTPGAKAPVEKDLPPKS